MYTDYGPKPEDRDYTRETERQFHRRHKQIGRWINRPFCDLCGPFRGRYLRPIGRPDGNGQEYRCWGCDHED